MEDPSQTTRGASTTSSNETSSASPFLALPPELRTIIYEHAVHDEVVRLNQKNGLAIFNSPLASTNRQIRGEYLPLLKSQYTSLTATVTDFNFDHIIRHINQIAGERSPGIRHARIRLHIPSGDTLDFCGYRPLYAWLLRADPQEELSEAVVDVEAEYWVVEPTAAREAQHMVWELERCLESFRMDRTDLEVERVERCEVEVAKAMEAGRRYCGERSVEAFLEQSCVLRGGMVEGGW